MVDCFATDFPSPSHRRRTVALLLSMDRVFWSFDRRQASKFLLQERHRHEGTISDTHWGTVVRNK